MIQISVFPFLIYTSFFLNAEDSVLKKKKIKTRPK